MSLARFQRSLPRDDQRTAAFLLAVRRASGGASYEPYRQDSTPWHAAMAAKYAHATAPLRRLADRYVVEAALAVANGDAVPDHVAAAFAELPDGDGSAPTSSAIRSNEPSTTSPRRSCSPGARVRCSTA